jgi:hypothetical protein
MDHGGTPVSDVAELEALLGEPILTVKSKARSELHDIHRL